MASRYTPLSPVYWNHHVAAKMRFDLWGSITYGQNLEPLGVRSRIAAISFSKLLFSTEWADFRLEARLDVTMGCGKNRDPKFPHRHDYNVTSRTRNLPIFFGVSDCQDQKIFISRLCPSPGVTYFKALQGNFRASGMERRVGKRLTAAT
jgi:hypothetical protein